MNAAPHAPGVIVAHTSPIVLTTHVRSTLLQSSIKLLRDRGHFERYETLLPATLREEVVMTLAPTWLPVGCAVAHYRACDQLALSVEELGVIGEAVGDQIQGTFLSTLVRGARAAGLTPWTLIANFDRLYGRLFRGGSVETRRLGPKEATVEVRGLAELPGVDYFRMGIGGVVRAGFRMAGANVVYVKAAPTTQPSSRLLLRISWV